MPNPSGDETWVLGSYYAMTPGPPVINGTIITFTGNWPHDPCSPAGLAFAFQVFAHEWLHNVCPKHSPTGAPKYPKNPSGKAPKPDCNNLNYAMHTAKAICDFIGAIASCLAHCPGETCPPLESTSGAIIPGTDTCAEIAELCRELARRYKDLQGKYNTEANAETAYNCKCGAPPWTPGAAYPACPEMPPPPGPCGQGRGAAYPGNKIIPDCPSSCP